jgi:hypothetical protein
MIHGAFAHNLNYWGQQQSAREIPGLGAIFTIILFPFPESRAYLARHKPAF